MKREILFSITKSEFSFIKRNATIIKKTLLLILSANFKKVSQVASSSPIIHPSVDFINESVSHLVDTHPVLVLQWCQVLRQLKYMDTQFWCGFLDTGLRLSTGRNSAISEGLPGVSANKGTWPFTFREQGSKRKIKLGTREKSIF